VHGLTTAASIWFTAALGVTAMLTLLWVSVLATVLAWFILAPLRRIEGLVKHDDSANRAVVKTDSGKDAS